MTLWLPRLLLFTAHEIKAMVDGHVDMLRHSGFNWTLDVKVLMKTLCCKQEELSDFFFFFFCFSFSPLDKTKVKLHLGLKCSNVFLFMLFS